jgi:hypothetical protein
MKNDTVTCDSLDNYYDGGGLYNFEGLCEISRCQITRNRAMGGCGGGIYNYNGVVRIDTSVLAYNVCKKTGGGICNIGGYCAVNASAIMFDSVSQADTPSFAIRVYGNAAHGGGVYNFSGVVFVENSTVMNNCAQALAINIINTGTAVSDYGDSALGAGICNQSGLCYVLNSTVAGNFAYASAKSPSSLVKVTGYSEGAGMYNASGKLTIHNSTIVENTCLTYADAYNWNMRRELSTGGGVFSDGGDCFALNAIMMGNTSRDSVDFIAGLGSRGVNSIVGTGMPTFMRNCKTGISTRQVFGVDTLRLADNGGPTKTLYPSSATSSAFGAGVRSGVWGQDTVIYTWHNTIPHGVYYKQNGWHSLETDSAAFQGIPVVEITDDQRGEPRGEPPCMGAVEFSLSKLKRDFFSSRRTGSLEIALVNHYMLIRSPFQSPLIVEMFEVSGRKLFTKTVTSPEKITCIALPALPKGLVLLHIASFREELRQKVVIR